MLINVYTVTPDLRPANDKVIPNLKLYDSDKLKTSADWCRLATLPWKQINI